jgi:phospholipid transport system substrate-binding protein
MKKLLIIFAILICNIKFVYGENPTDFIKNIINECKPALINKNDTFLEKTMEKYIDFNEIAIWIAGKNIWKDSTEIQKTDFIKQLKQLMLKTYSKTVYYYIDSEVEFLTPKNKKFDLSSNNRIQISSIMKKNNKNVTISYRLIKNNDSWLVFDVIIEGISILKSLRTQYSDIIKIHGIEQATIKIKKTNSP